MTPCHLCKISTKLDVCISSYTNSMLRPCREIKNFFNLKKLNIGHIIAYNVKAHLKQHISRIVSL